MADTNVNVIPENKYMTFRGKPLVRHGNVIVMGDMVDKYILFMMILTTKKIVLAGGKTGEVPDKILVQLLSTDPSKSPADKVAKQFDKTGLYEAFDIGLIWLGKLNS